MFFWTQWWWLGPSLACKTKQKQFVCDLHDFFLTQWWWLGPSLAWKTKPKQSVVIYVFWQKTRLPPTKGGARTLPLRKIHMLIFFCYLIWMIFLMVAEAGGPNGYKQRWLPIHGFGKWFVILAAKAWKTWSRCITIWMEVLFFWIQEEEGQLNWHFFVTGNTVPQTCFSYLCSSDGGTAWLQ